MTTHTTAGVKGGIGTSVRRPDGTPKVMGNFAYASDLWSEDMLWGSTRRSPHAHARLTKLDLAPALTASVMHVPVAGQQERFAGSWFNPAWRTAMTSQPGS